jgi:hypothetical protein
MVRSVDRGYMNGEIVILILEAEADDWEPPSQHRARTLVDFAQEDCLEACAVQTKFDSPDTREQACDVHGFLP